MGEIKGRALPAVYNFVHISEVNSSATTLFSVCLDPMMQTERPPLHRAQPTALVDSSPSSSQHRSSPVVTFTSAPPRLSNTNDAAADARAALAALASGEVVQAGNDAWSFERRRDSAEALQMCQENVNW